MYCKSSGEKRAKQNLQNQHIHSFFPVLQKQVLRKDKKVLIESALFPGYLFVNVSPKDPAFHKILSTRGIIDFVRYGQEAAKVSDQLIQQLHLLCHEHNPQNIEPTAWLKPGEKIEIVAGPFKGLTAIFDCEDGLERSVLLLNILNKENKLSFKNSEIMKTDK